MRAGRFPTFLAETGCHDALFIAAIWRRDAILLAIPSDYWLNKPIAVGRIDVDDHREPKKTDHIQIRLSSETKQEFLDACREDRMSASAVLRKAITDYLARRKRLAAASALKVMPRLLRRRRYLAAGAASIGLALLATMPSAAEPDFAAAFNRLDRNGDGVLSREEFALRGPDGDRYATPVGRYETADGFGVEVWESPFGVRTVSMSLDGALWLAPKYDVLRTQPDKSAIVWRAMSDRDRSGSVALDELEEYLRGRAEQVFAAGDANGDRVLTEEEITAIASPVEQGDFQGGPGGLAMRTKRGDLAKAALVASDINGDRKVTEDEALETWLTRLVGAYAPEK